jgi:hypothetical protein
MTKPKPREKSGRDSVSEVWRGDPRRDPPYCSGECATGGQYRKAGSGTTEDPDDW